MRTKARQSQRGKIFEGEGGEAGVCGYRLNRNLLEARFARAHSASRSASDGAILNIIRLLLAWSCELPDAASDATGLREPLRPRSAP